MWGVLTNLATREFGCIFRMSFKVVIMALMIFVDLGWVPAV